MSTEFVSPALHDDFCPFAEQMRAAFDAHFADPYAMTPARHFVWNYWHVPDRYTYLRSELPAVLGRDLANRFMTHLETWALLHTGLRPRVPWLSLYVDGCEQNLHNDAANGRLAYVFSLTRWQERRFSGGETLLLRPQDRRELTQSRSRADLVQTVPAEFNRLVLFDDRLPHGVTRLSGSMAPQQCRVVIHGHLLESDPVAIGPLPAEAFIPHAGLLAERLGEIGDGTGNDVDGVCTFRVDIDRSGAAGKVHMLTDLAWAFGSEGEKRKRAAIDQAQTLLQTLQGLPAAPAPSVVIAALRFGRESRRF